MGSSGGLVAMIVDEDTATGMLLAGIGQTDIKKNTNFLIVNDSTWSEDAILLEKLNSLPFCFFFSLQRQQRVILRGRLQNLL
jgi:hypothetical protein